MDNTITLIKHKYKILFKKKHQRECNVKQTEHIKIKQSTDYKQLKLIFY